MKKLTLSVLALTLAFSITACGNNEEQDPSTQEPTVTEAPATTEAPTEAPSEAPAATEAPTEEPAATEAPATEETAEPSTETENGETLGTTLLKEFQNIMAAEEAPTAYAVAEKLIAHESILFMGGAIEVEPGLLSGFDNYEVTGFEEGAMFAPMMGSIPFVGYVFKLAEDVDANAFAADLITNANPRWQICVEAEETQADTFENYVFFLMSPTTLEE